jgi:hypothetical protein
MQFPFQNKTHEEGGLIGQTFSVYGNEKLTNAFSFISNVTFMSDGKTGQGWHWEIDSGQLYVLNDTGDRQFEFNGVELVNGRVVAVGLQLAERTVKRVIMHEQKPLSDEFWEIRVSSCKNHQEKVIPAFRKSLKRANVTEDKVTVVVGSVPYAEAYSSKSGDMTFVSDERNLKGFTGLLPSYNNKQRIYPDSYYVLLHDTCTVKEGFLEWLSDIDLGLNPDVILFRPPNEGTELGVYSGKFLIEQEDLEVWKEGERLPRLLGRANVVMVIGGHMTIRPPEDHYDEKKMRQEIVLARPHISKMKTVKSRGPKR